MEKVELIIPEGWQDVSLYQFIEYNSYDYTSLNQAQSDIQKISILCNTDYDEIKKLKVSKLRGILDEMKWFNTEPNTNYSNVFEINGVKYGVINFDTLTVAEWMDLEHYIEDGVLKNMHIILSIVIRPLIKYIDDNNYKVEEYDNETVISRSELFLSEMKVDRVYGILVFFCLFAIEYIKLYNLEATKELVEEMDQLKERLKEKD